MIRCTDVTLRRYVTWRHSSSSTSVQLIRRPGSAARSWRNAIHFSSTQLHLHIQWQCLTQRRTLKGLTVTHRQGKYRGVDGICGSGQSGTVKNGGVENAGVDISARYDKGGHCRSGQINTIWQGWTLREWTMRHHMAGVDNAGGKNVSKLA